MGKKKITDMSIKELTKRYLGKVGSCNNAILGLTDKNGNPISGSHFVYIRELQSGGKCNVNTITSLENYLCKFNEKTKKFEKVLDKKGNPIVRYDFDKLDKVKVGYLYPVPKCDAGFPLWSAINLDNNINGINIADIEKVGKVNFKRRHKFFVGKYSGDYSDKNKPRKK